MNMINNMERYIMLQNWALAITSFILFQQAPPILYTRAIKGISTNIMQQTNLNIRPNTDLKYPQSSENQKKIDNSTFPAMKKSKINLMLTKRTNKEKTSLHGK